MLGDGLRSGAGKSSSAAVGALAVVALGIRPVELLAAVAGMLGTAMPVADRQSCMVAAGRCVAALVGWIVVEARRHCVVPLESRQQIRHLRHLHLLALEHSSRPADVSTSFDSQDQTTHLDEVLALWLGDQWLEFGCSKRIDQPGLRHHEQQHLRASED